LRETTISEMIYQIERQRIQDENQLSQFQAQIELEQQQYLDNNKGETELLRQKETIQRDKDEVEADIGVI